MRSTKIGCCREALALSLRTSTGSVTATSRREEAAPSGDKFGSHRRTETGQRGDVAGQTLELPIVTRNSAAAPNCDMEPGPSQSARKCLASQRSCDPFTILRAQLENLPIMRQKSSWLLKDCRSRPVSVASPQRMLGRLFYRTPVLRRS